MSRCARCNASLTDSATTADRTSEDPQGWPPKAWDPQSLGAEAWPPEPWRPEPQQGDPAPAQPWLPEPAYPGDQHPAGPPATGPEPPPAGPPPAQPWKPEPWKPEPWKPEPWRPESAGPGPTPWEPGSLGTEALPSDQPWRVDPAAAGAPNAPTVAEGHLPPAPEAPVPWRPPPEPKRRTAPLLIGAWAIVMVAAVVAAGIAFWPTGDPSPQGTVSPQSVVSSQGSVSPETAVAAPLDGGGGTAQATEVNSVLDDMAGSRSELGAALQDAAQCATLAGALPTIQKVVGEREQQLAKAKDLQVDALDAGDQLKDALTRALQASLDADHAYQAWAEGAQGCTGDTPTDADYERGNNISENQATPAKEEFLGLWTPIAQQEHQPTRDKDHI
jgi:hypothetical protein